MKSLCAKSIIIEFIPVYRFQFGDSRRSVALVKLLHVVLIGIQHLLFWVICYSMLKVYISPKLKT